jgi:N-acetylglucosamine kinase-like BadF-type ATPase
LDGHVGASSSVVKDLPDHRGDSRRVNNFCYLYHSGKLPTTQSTEVTVSTCRLDERRILAIDLGKTSCRGRIEWADGVAEACTGGAAGLAGHGGLGAAQASIRELIAKLPPRALAAVEGACIGAAGVDAAAKNARELASWLSRTLVAETAAPDYPRSATRAVASRLPVVIVSDALTAHAGAFCGRPGTVLVAGTGAVAFRVDDDGTLHRADGWGPWLGDEGSGRWIGQEGFASALRGHDGRGPATSLTAAAIQRAGSIDALPAYVMHGTAPERVLGSFAPVVLEHAIAGDEIAARVVTQAVFMLARIASAASGGRGEVAVLGGLVRAPAFAEHLRQALATAGLLVVSAAGDALDGGALFARRSDLPHERYAIRV